VLRYGEALQVAEHARASALLLNSGHDDHALQDRILDYLGDILGPLPGDAAATPAAQATDDDDLPS
jgi:hypothetical protein